MNIFYQLIGFGALIAMGLSYWQNDKCTILLWQVVANLIFAIHYTLLHAPAHCAAFSRLSCCCFSYCRRNSTGVNWSPRYPSWQYFC